MPILAIVFRMQKAVIVRAPGWGKARKRHEVGMICPHLLNNTRFENILEDGRQLITFLADIIRTAAELARLPGTFC